MICKPGDIVIVPFPYSDRIGKARYRPAVVVSGDPVFHGKTGVIIVAMITSTRRGWPHDAPVSGLAAAGLRIPCAVRMKLFTLEQSHIVRAIGRLNKKDKQALAASLRAVLTGLTPRR